MRLSKKFYFTILVLMFTLIQPLSTVRASTIASHVDTSLNSKINLPNNGRSDLQVLIKRVATDDTAITETAAENSNEQDAKTDMSKSHSNDMVVASSTKTRASVMISGTNGTSTWIFDPDNHKLTFKDGKLDERIESNISEQGVDPDDVITIEFETMVVAPDDVSGLFSQLHHFMNLLKPENLDTSNVETMFEWFMECSELSVTDLTAWRVNRVKRFDFMFYLTGIKDLNLSDWGVNFSTKFEYMFAGTPQLKTLNLSNWGANRPENYRDVDMSHMFENAVNLTTLNLANFGIDTVTDMSFMFAGTPIVNLDLSTWKVPRVKSFQNMFYHMSELKSLKLTEWGQGRTATDVNMACMFYDTVSLKELDIAKWSTSNVTNMQFMFYNTGMEALSLSTWDVRKVANFEGMFAQARELYSLDLREWRWYDLDPIANVDMSHMMADTPKLTSVVFYNFSTKWVDNTSSMFANSGVTKLDLSSWDTTRVTNCSNMFTGATNLWQLTLGTNTRLTTGTPNVPETPTVGTIINDGTQTYKTTAASWQIVGSGTVHNPKGDSIRPTEMWVSGATRPVTYVWTQAPIIELSSNIEFGTLSAASFRNNQSPIATNMSVGQLNVSNFENGVNYRITVKQTSDWESSDTTEKITKSDLKIKYGTDDMSAGEVNFWQGVGANSQTNIRFNYDTSKNFNIWLNRDIVITPELLEKQLHANVVWSLNDTP